MTWKNILLQMIGLTFLWFIGISSIQFPGGVYGWLLRKAALLALNLSQRSEWLYDAWSKQMLPGMGMTYYRLLEQISHAPSSTVREYLSKIVVLYKVFGVVWLGITGYVTYMLVSLWINGAR